MSSIFFQFDGQTVLIYVPFLDIFEVLVVFSVEYWKFEQYCRNKFGEGFWKYLSFVNLLSNSKIFHRCMLHIYVHSCTAIRLWEKMHTDKEKFSPLTLTFKKSTLVFKLKPIRSDVAPKWMHIFIQNFVISGLICKISFMIRYESLHLFYLYMQLGFVILSWYFVHVDI